MKAKTIFDSCEPRPEVLKGELREEIFAARLRDVIESKADPVYQDPATFFDNTCARELAHGTPPRQGLGAIKGESDVVKLPSSRRWARPGQGSIRPSTVKGSS
jgi:hypothetical protein